MHKTTLLLIVFELENIMKGGKQKCDIEGRDFKEVAKIELLGHLVGHQLGSELVLDEGGEGGEHIESLRHPLLHLVTRLRRSSLVF